jgi:hypothetical protein
VQGKLPIESSEPRVEPESAEAGRGEHLLAAHVLAISQYLAVITIVVEVFAVHTAITMIDATPL